METVMQDAEAISMEIKLYIDNTEESDIVRILYVIRFREWCMSEFSIINFSAVPAGIQIRMPHIKSVDLRDWED